VIFEKSVSERGLVLVGGGDCGFQLFFGAHFLQSAFFHQDYFVDERVVVFSEILKQELELAEPVVAHALDFLPETGFKLV
jgi:hypothetical protein